MEKAAPISTMPNNECGNWIFTASWFSRGHAIDERASLTHAPEKIDKSITKSAPKHLHRLFSQDLERIVAIIDDRLPPATLS